MNREARWNTVYETKQPDSVSWYQRSPERSMTYIQKFAEPTQRVIDVGAGASLLVDALLDAGYRHPIVLDVSASGVEHAKTRLGKLADFVNGSWLM